MGMLRKGSRRIVIDGLEYRWRIRQKPTYGQGNAWGPLIYAVQLATENGAVLVVRTSHPRPDNWLKEKAVAVTPLDVERCIRAALQLGWLPAKPGKPFDYDDNQ